MLITTDIVARFGANTAKHNLVGTVVSLKTTLLDAVLSDPGKTHICNGNQHSIDNSTHWTPHQLFEVEVLQVFP